MAFACDLRMFATPLWETLYGHQEIQEIYTIALICDFDVSHTTRPWQPEAAFASTSFRWELKLQGAGGRRLASLSSAELLEKLKAKDSADLPKNNQKRMTLQ